MARPPDGGLSVPHSRRYISAAEAELAAAIKRRRDAEGSRLENVFIAVIVILPLIAFAVAFMASLR